MEKYLLQMNTPDNTPMPVEVDIPRPTESTPGLAIEAQKESRVRSSRGLMRNLVLPGVAAAAVLVGPHARDAVNNYNEQDARQEIAALSQQEIPRSLRGAQSTAQGELFGHGEDAHKNLQAILTQAKVDLRDKQWQLPAGQFVSPEQVKISEDGKTVEIGGQPISFAGVRGEDGNIYIVAARAVEEDKLLSDDHLHVVNPALIGGAKFSAEMDKGELVKKAYADARENLDKSLEQFKEREFADDRPTFNKDELIARK